MSETAPSPWKKMVDGQPTEADYPIACWESKAKSEYLFTPPTLGPYHPFNEKIWTHWRSLGRVSPPTAELTQREKDRAMVETFVREDWARCGPAKPEHAMSYFESEVKAGLSILHAERREILAPLKEIMKTAETARNVNFNVDAKSLIDGLKPLIARLETQGGES